MPISSKRSVLVSAGLTVSHLLFAALARGQTVSFIASLDFEAGSDPQSVAVGNFNGDGALDVVVANLLDNNVSVLLGNGDGSFQAARTFAAGNGPLSVAVGDFNGDGALDLAVANLGSNNVSVLLGSGDGSFQAARNFDAGNSPRVRGGGGFQRRWRARRGRGQHGL